jgi:hypothetical protein
VPGRQDQFALPRCKDSLDQYKSFLSFPYLWAESAPCPIGTNQGLKVITRQGKPQKHKPPRKDKESGAPAGARGYRFLSESSIGPQTPKKCPQTGDSTFGHVPPWETRFARPDVSSPYLSFPDHNIVSVRNPIDRPKRFVIGLIRSGLILLQERGHGNPTQWFNG